MSASTVFNPKSGGPDHANLLLADGGLNRETHSRLREMLHTHFIGYINFPSVCRISLDLTLINVLCSSTHPKGNAHRLGSYSETDLSKAAIFLIKPELHQSCRKTFISEDKINLNSVYFVLTILV